MDILNYGILVTLQHLDRPFTSRRDLMVIYLHGMYQMLLIWDLCFLVQKSLTSHLINGMLAV